MATVYNRHELEKDLLGILGLSSKSVRRIELTFEVNSLVIANVEFFPDNDEVKKIIETVKEKYIFEVKNKQELIYIDNKTL